MNPTGTAAMHNQYCRRHQHKLLNHKPPSRKRLNQNGFTLLELLISIGIVAILAAIAVPSFDYLNNRRVTQTQVENLQRALALARQTALAKNRQVVLCPSSDGNACVVAGDWSSGYLVYIDANKNETFDSAAGDVPVEFIYGVRSVAGRQSSSNLRHKLLSNINEKRAVFNAQGFTVGHMQTFTYCDGNGQKKFTLTVNITGRVQVAAGDDSSC